MRLYGGRNKYLENGENGSRSRTWTTTKCHARSAITTTKTLWPRSTENATPTNSTFKVSFLSVKLSCRDFPLPGYYRSLPGIAAAIQPQAPGASTDYLSASQTVNRLQQDFMQNSWTAANYRSLIPSGFQVSIPFIFLKATKFQGGALFTPSSMAYGSFGGQAGLPSRNLQQLYGSNMTNYSKCA